MTVLLKSRNVVKFRFFVFRLKIFRFYFFYISNTCGKRERAALESKTGQSWASPGGSGLSVNHAPAPQRDAATAKLPRPPVTHRSTVLPSGDAAGAADARSVGAGRGVEPMKRQRAPHHTDARYDHEACTCRWSI